MPPRKGNRRLKAACRFIDDQDQPADKRGRNIDSLDNIQTLVQSQMQSDHSNRNVETMLKEDRASSVQGISDEVCQDTPNSPDTSIREEWAGHMQVDADLDLMISITRQSSQQITGEGTQARGSNTSLDISVNNTDQVISSHINLKRYSHLIWDKKNYV